MQCKSQNCFLQVQGLQEQLKKCEDELRATIHVGVDPIIEWSYAWNELARQGVLEPIETTDSPQLTRMGLLQVDSLLSRFFD